MTTSTGERIADLLLGRGRADGVAIVEGDRSLRYDELRHEVAVRAAELDLPPRSVVVLAGPAGIQWITTYLALLQEGHVPLLAGDHLGLLVEAWQPDATITAAAEGIELDRHGRDPRRPELHPDLALLLSTSGSTGSPKLVRLSHRNLTSHADAIVEVLGLTAADCGVTSLPLHYCYGLSVLHSHLAAGARLVAITASVVDPCFAAAVRRHGVTSIAGVPHTFDLLETAGPDRVLAPSVRLLTQAGGRMGPASRERWRRRAAAHDADLLVMYGQTEATARMAYLPPELAEACPSAVGVAIPGGALRIEPHGDRTDGVGELVYAGPNVMMGYATRTGDLATGPMLHELRTGDLGRFDVEHGVFEVVGRASRFIKPFGLRIDLDVVESRLGAVLGPVAVTGDDDRLVVAAPGQEPTAVLALVRDACGLPEGRVTVLSDPIPRLASGKADLGALRRRAEEQEERAAAGARPGGRPVSAILAEVLGRPNLRPDQTFVSAGGDSLSYIEASMRLEQAVGALPDDWQHRPVGELERELEQDLASSSPSRRRNRIDTTALLRAIGISTVVATHMHLVFFPGGAHLLLAVAGYNLSRFQLGLDGSGARARAVLRTVGRVAVPTVLWAGAMFALGRGYGWPTIGLVNGYLGPRGHQQGMWHFWFIEAFAQLTLVVTGLLAVPALRRLDRRLPYAFPCTLLLGAIALRAVTLGGIDDPFNLRFRTHGVAAFFVLGWLIHRSPSPLQRSITGLLCLATVVGFFDQPVREGFIVVGLVALTWFRTVPFPRWLVPAVSTLAAASMWILISHFQIWPELHPRLPMPVAYPLTIALGIAIWKVVEVVPRGVRQRTMRVARGGARATDARLAPSPA
jgi:acyl-CoA synthetase (AMP-forming)/AMP-acid ligase II